MNVALALYSVLVASVVTVRFPHIKSRLQLLLRRAPMTIGSFWFSGSFKLTESIQRQEFAVLAYLATALVIFGGAFSGISLIFNKDSQSAVIVLLAISLACLFYCFRRITTERLRLLNWVWPISIVHASAFVTVLLGLSR